jgi:hypothetical protein
MENNRDSSRLISITVSTDITTYWKRTSAVTTNETEIILTNQLNSLINDSDLSVYELTAQC